MENIEIRERKEKQIGLRITKQDERMLKEIAKSKKAKPTALAYALFRKKLIEVYITQN